MQSKYQNVTRVLAAACVTMTLCNPLVFAQVGTSPITSSLAGHPAVGAHGPFGQGDTSAHALPHNNPTQSGIDLGAHWKPIGPSPVLEDNWNNGMRNDSGRVATMAIGETHNGKTIYVGAANGGVWSSSNDGLNWNPLTDDQASLATGSVAVDPNDPNTIYVGTGEQHFSADSRYGQGILKSADGGKHWTTLGVDTFGGLHIGKVAVDPFNSNNVWVAADNGLYLSTDGGQTWEQQFAGQFDMWPFAHIERPTDVYIDAKTPGTIYLSVQGGGLYKSADGGQTFDLMGVGEPGTRLPNWSIDMTDPGYHMFNASFAVVEGGKDVPDTIYTAYSDRSGNLMGVFVSADGGDTWTRLSNVPQYFDSNYSYMGEYDSSHPVGQGWYDNVIAVDPTDPKHILAGGITLVESRDGGTTWKTLDIFFKPQPGNIDIHPDQHAIVFDSHGNAYVGNDGGVFKESKDGGWTNLNSNLNTVTFYPGLSAVNDGKLVMAGAQDNGTSIFSGKRSWPETLGGDGGYTYVDPGNPLDMFAEFQFGGICHSSDGGKNWDYAMPAYLTPDYVDQEDGMKDFYAPFITPFHVRPLSSGKHEVLVGADFLYRSTDDGANYTPISPYLGTISSVAQSTADPNVIYVGTTTGQVWASFTGGGRDYANWQRITPFDSDPENRPDASGQVVSISISPENDKEITITYGNSGYYSPVSSNHVFWTGDTSAASPTWKNVSANLPSTLVMSSTYMGHVVVVGTEQGVYIAKSGTSDWYKLGSGMPNVPITSLVYTGNGKLIAGTYGRGAFTLELADAMKLVN